MGEAGELVIHVTFDELMAITDRIRREEAECGTQAAADQVAPRVMREMLPDQIGLIEVAIASKRPIHLSTDPPRGSKPGQEATLAPDDRMRCKHCGVVLPASCPADDGYGCPSWEDFKEQEAERGRPT